MKVTHPLANRETTPPDAASVAPGESYPIEDGAVDVPDAVAADLAAAWSDHYGVSAAELLGGEGVEPPFDPAELTNDEISDRVADIDNAAELKALRQAEKDAKGRDGATDAIGARLDELED